MPLTICPQCKEDVSPDNSSCPHCGASIGDSPDATRAREAAEEERRNRKTIRIYCIVAMLLGIATWFVGVVTITFLLMITGGAIAVAAGCGLRQDWFD